MCGWSSNFRSRPACFGNRQDEPSLVPCASRIDSALQFVSVFRGTEAPLDVGIGLIFFGDAFGAARPGPGAVVAGSTVVVTRTFAHAELSFRVHAGADSAAQTSFVGETVIGCWPWIAKCIAAFVRRRVAGLAGRGSIVRVALPVAVRVRRGVAWTTDDVLRVWVARGRQELFWIEGHADCFFRAFASTAVWNGAVAARGGEIADTGSVRGAVHVGRTGVADLVLAALHEHDAG